VFGEPATAAGGVTLVLDLVRDRGRARCGLIPAEQAGLSPLTQQRAADPNHPISEHRPLVFQGVVSAFAANRTIREPTGG
jgi:hypothetical protein